MERTNQDKCHECAPAEWRSTPDRTGSYELDRVIARSLNVDMIDRLQDHLTDDQAYKRQTSYTSGPIS